jgi:hypothetical protein
MEVKDALIILLKNIEKDLNHQDYKRVTELANDYRFFITGKGIDKRLKRFNPREDDIMFQQRCQLTIPITPAATASLITPFYKVARTKPLIERITASKKTNNKNQSEVLERMLSFYGSDSNDNGVDYFLKNRFVELSFWDPNAWVVIEFDAFDSKKEKARPRPFEVSSEEAVNFSIKNNTAEWLIVKQKIKLQDPKNKDKQEDGLKWTMYGDNDAIVAEQTLKSLKEASLELSPGQQVTELDKRVYIITTYNHKAGKVPAFRVGYKRDMESGGRTFLSPFHNALCYLEKSIKQGSEFDLSTCLHTFPQKIVRLGKGCPGDGKSTCHSGRLKDGSLCSVCKGSGKPIHTSGQDIVEVELPDTKDDLVPLNDFVYYVPLPIELLKLQKQWLDDLKTECHQAVFNSTVLVKKQFSSSGDTAAGGQPATATEKDQDMDSVYDTLNPFADKVSNVWRTIVEFIVIFTDNVGKVDWVHRFPTNFKLKSKEMLYQDMATANTGNLPAFVKEAITDELAEQVFVDDPKGIIRYRIQKMHYPFNGKSENEIMTAINSEFVLKETKVLFHYYDYIFDLLESEYEKNGKDFYVDTNVEVRTEAIKAKVQAIIDQLDSETPAAVPYGAEAGTPPPADPPNA